MKRTTKILSAIVFAMFAAALFLYYRAVGGLAGLNKNLVFLALPVFISLALFIFQLARPSMTRRQTIWSAKKSPTSILIGGLCGFAIYLWFHLKHVGH